MKRPLARGVVFGAMAALALGVALVVPAPAQAGGSAPEIVVLGGPGAVSDAVLAHLSSCTNGTVRRVAGANRFATAREVSKDTFASSTSVFVATGENFPDAVAAGSPAALGGAPVLLTRAGSLPAESANEISRLGASTIYILGGPSAVSEAVENALSALGTTQRLSGANRFATAAAISQSRFPTADTVYIATGLNFPDALAGAPAAAADGAPILLITRDTIPAATQAELNRLNPTNTVVLGGTAVISDSVAAALPGTVTRLAGANRYATAAAISQANFSPGVPVIYVSTGLNFPDALAGGAAGGLRGGPVLLVAGDSVPSVTAAEIQRLTGVACSPFTPISFGNGTWIVGTDIPAGRYRMISDGTSCYWERLSGFSGELADILANSFSFDTQIVDIAQSDVGFGSSNCNTWSNDLGARRADPAAPLVSDGHYLVGSEVASGTWASVGPAAGESCYWERLSGFSGQLADIISNDFTDTNSIVTISVTDVGFYADPDCGTWTKIG